MKEATLVVKDVVGSSDVEKIRRALINISSIASVEMRLDLGSSSCSLSLAYDEKAIKLSSIVKILKHMGYPPTRGAKKTKLRIKDLAPIPCAC